MEAQDVPTHIRAAQNPLFALKPVLTVQSNSAKARSMLKKRKANGKKLDERMSQVVASKRDMDEFLRNLGAVLSGAAAEIPDMTVRWRKELKELKKATQKANTPTEKRMKNMAVALNTVYELVNSLKKTRERDIMEIETLKGQLESFISSSAEELQKIQQSELMRPPSAVGTSVAEEGSTTGALNTSMFLFIDYQNVTEGKRASKRGKSRKKVAAL